MHPNQHTDLVNHHQRELLRHAAASRLAVETTRPSAVARLWIRLSAALDRPRPASRPVAPQAARPAPLSGS